MKHLGVFLCLKYLSRRKIVILSIIAVAISCALLIVVDSLFTGFINTFENSAGQYLGDVIIEAPAGQMIPDYDQFIDRLKQTEMIQAATGVLSGQGLLHFGPGKVRAVLCWGIEVPDRFAVDGLDKSLLIQKNLPQEQIRINGNNGSAVGGFVGIGCLGRPDDKTDEYDMEQIHSYVGKRMSVTTGSMEDTQAEPRLGDNGRGGNEESKPRFRRKVIRFELTDVVFTGYHEFDKNFVYLPIDALAAQLYPDKGQVADRLQIRLTKNTDPDKAIAVVRGVWASFAEEKKIRWHHLAKINTSRSLQAPFVAEYRKQMSVLMVIFGIVSMGVISLMFCIFYLIVMTKRKDIAVVKSCGMPSSSVANLFVTFGLIVGAVGSALGVTIGYFVTKNINVIEHWIAATFGLKVWKASTYMFTRIPNEVDWAAVAWIVPASILAAGLGALIPAILAARMQPVKLLRYE